MGEGSWWWWRLVTQSCPTLATLWTVAHQAPLSMGLSRQQHWSGLPFPSPDPNKQAGTFLGRLLALEWGMLRLQTCLRKNSASGHMGWAGRRPKTEATAVLRWWVMTASSRSVTEARRERKASVWRLSWREYLSTGLKLQEYQGQLGKTEHIHGQARWTRHARMAKRAFSSTASC